MRKLFLAFCSVVVLCLLIASLQSWHLSKILAAGQNAPIKVVKESPPAAPKPALKALAAPNPHLPDDVKRALEVAAADTRKQAEATEQAAADPHATPAAILEGGARIGEVYEQELKHPELKAEFQKFYLDCAHDEATITVNRVQCLEHYMESEGLRGEKARALVSTMPEAVRRIYNRLAISR